MHIFSIVFFGILGKLMVAVIDEGREIMSHPSQEALVQVCTRSSG